MIHKTTRSILSVLLAALLLVTSTPLTPAFAGDGGAVSLQSESGESEGLTGSGAANDPYQIATANDLREFADKVNNQGQTSAWAVLTDDIDLSGICSEESDTSWTPIGNSEESAYIGTFDGQNFKISGLTINNSSAKYQGLFGYVSGTVKDLTVSGTVSGGMYVGGIAGQNNGNVINCAFSGSVTNCYNTGAVSGGEYVGGVVGSNSFSATVTNCYNTGTVTGTGYFVGGVVGYNAVTPRGGQQRHKLLQHRQRQRH